MDRTKVLIYKRLFFNGKFLQFGALKQTQSPFLGGTPPETNMAPKNRYLEKEFPIGNHHLKVPAVSFRECIFEKNEPKIQKSNQRSKFEGPHHVGICVEADQGREHHWILEAKGSSGKISPPIVVETTIGLPSLKLTFSPLKIGRNPIGK